MKFVKATCPSCGANLELSASLTTADCPNCGNKIILDWGQQSSNVAANLELGKQFVRTGNLEEAGRQFTHVLERNPENKEAWFWKGVCAKYFSEKHSAWKNCGFTREQMIQNLASIASGQNLLDTYSGYYGDRHEMGYDEVASIYLDAALQAIYARPNRKNCLETIANMLGYFQYYLWQNYFAGIDFAKDEYERKIVRHSCKGLGMLLQRLGADQKEDWIEGYKFYQILISKERSRVRGNLTYWRKYIQQLEARLPSQTKR